MRAVPMAFFIFLYAVAAFSARAEEPAWKTVTPPAFADHVVSFEQPAGWELENDVSERGFRFRKGGKMLFFPFARISLWGRTKATQNKASETIGITMNLHDLPKPVSLDRWVEVLVAGWKNFAMIVHEKGFDRLSGQRAFYYFKSGETVWKNGKKVKATEPNGRDHIAVLNDRLLIELSFSASTPALFKKYAPVFERIEKSLKVTPVSALDPSRISHVYKSPEIRISQRRDYYLDTFFSLELPPGWSAFEAAVEPATVKREGGLLVVEAGPDALSEDLSFMVVVQGMPVTALTGSDYLATADRVIGALMPEHSPGEAVETSAAPSPFHCQALRKQRHGEGTRKTYVKTYTGKDRDGRPLKARVYTLGGMTMVCNLVYIDAPATFDKYLPLIDGIVKSFKSSEYSPSFRR